MKSLKKVLIMAGGTGGHVYPALAVANTLRHQGIQVDWLGTSSGFEAKVVPDANIPFHVISISGVRGKGKKTLWLAPFRLIKAIAQAFNIIRRLNPDVVLGFGGFASGPGGIASFLLRKPLIIHEQNAKAGLTNQWLSKVSTKILEGFPNTFSPSAKVMSIGNPVRQDIQSLPSPRDRFKHRTGELRLLVIGGSLGAQAINELMPKMLAQLPESERPQVKHQTGIQHYADTVQHYQAASVSAEIMPYIEDMAAVYAWADLVICRAGALTIAELCAAGLGAILIPFPQAVDDHQTLNARYLVNQGAALLIQQKDLTAEVLIDYLRRLSPEKRLAMAEAAFQLRKTDTAQQVLTICQEVCQ